MADYRTPLPAMLAGLLEAGANRVLALDDRSVDRLERVAGKTLQLDLDGLAITLFFHFDHGNVMVSTHSENEPQATVRGTPVALFGLAGSASEAEWGVPGSGVRIEGDAALARDLGSVFSQLEPDWEGPLAEILGDTIGFQLAAGLRRGAEAVRRAALDSKDMVGRFLREESDALAPAASVSEFNTEVDDLRDDTDRLAARITRLERRRSAE